MWATKRGKEEAACSSGLNQRPAEKLRWGGEWGIWKEEKEEQREETPLKLLTLLRDLSPLRCESHMFGEGGGRFKKGGFSYCHHPFGGGDHTKPLKKTDTAGPVSQSSRVMPRQLYESRGAAFSAM